MNNVDTSLDIPALQTFSKYYKSDFNMMLINNPNTVEHFEFNGENVILQPPDPFYLLFQKVN